MSELQYVQSTSFGSYGKIAPQFPRSMHTPALGLDDGRGLTRSRKKLSSNFIDFPFELYSYPTKVFLNLSSVSNS